ncbi:hypothetical protein [Citrobacter phage vB_CfrS_K1M]
MTKWKYLKGSEKDFEGAPEWATIRERMNDSREYFVERYECDKRYTNAIHKGDEFRFLVNDFGTGDIIAEREPVTSADVEVVKYDPTKVDGEQRMKCGELKIDGETHESTINKYTRDCKGVQVDVYDVLQAFDVTNPALQHLIKKALCVGIRGHKTKQQDLQDIIDSAIRAKELESNK